MPPYRLALVLVGLAGAVYGVASLTGERLGTPPWWRENVTGPSGPDETGRFGPSMTMAEPRQGREWISGGVVAVGLGLVAVGAWPRRRRPAPDPVGGA